MKEELPNSDDTEKNIALVSLRTSTVVPENIHNWKQS